MKLVKIEDQYNHFPQLKEMDVKKLQEWIKKQPHLPTISELEAIVFLHSCYYSIENAKLCIDAYYTFRTHCPEFFENRNLKDKALQLAMNTMIYVPLKGQTIEQYNVIYAHFHDPDSSNFVLIDAIRLFTIAIDSSLMEDGIAEGHILLVDMENLALGHITKLGLLMIKKFMVYLQDALPVRLKGFHFINVGPLVDKFISVLKPFMKKELLNVMQFHSTMDTIYEYVPRNMFPNECGGMAGTRDEIRKNYYDHIMESSEYYLNDKNIKRVNEKLRPGKPKSVNDLFGIDGNFKKLDID